MAAIAKSGTPSVSTAVPGFEHMITGLYAGEAIAAGDACYIKGSDGLVYRSDGTAVAAAAKVRGYAPVAAAVGEAVSLYHGVAWNYGSGLTPGADVFLSSATLGALSDVATTGGTAPIGFVIDATRIYLKQSTY